MEGVVAVDGGKKLWVAMVRCYPMLMPRRWYPMLMLRWHPKLMLRWYPMRMPRWYPVLMPNHRSLENVSKKKFTCFGWTTS